MHFSHVLMLQCFALLAIFQKSSSEELTLRNTSAFNANISISITTPSNQNTSQIWWKIVVTFECDLSRDDMCSSISLWHIINYLLMIHIFSTNLGDFANALLCLEKAISFFSRSEINAELS